MKKQLKCKSLIWLIVVMLSFGGAVTFPSIEVHAETVYITSTGSKYHTHKCGNGTFYPTSLEEAQAKGLTPCSKCYNNSAPPAANPPAPEAPSEPPSEPVQPVIPMKLSKTSLLLLKSQSSKLTLHHALGAVSWSSSNKSVASVFSNGKVTAKKKGKATITAISNDTQKTCQVTVEDPKLNASRISLKKSASKKLRLSGCRHKVSWSSSNPSVAKVKNGTVTAKDAGNATITAKVHGKKFKCKVTVAKPKVQKVTVKQTSITMGYNKDTTIKLTVTPQNVQKYYRTTVKSSDKSIVQAEISPNGKSIYLSSGEKTGTAIISVTVGNVSSKCTVNVIPGIINSLSLSDSSIQIKPGNNHYISYNISPYDADEYYQVEWSSSNKNVATVESSWSNYATITAVGEGEADITVKIGNSSATCHVVITKSVDNFN